MNNLKEYHHVSTENELRMSALMDKEALGFIELLEMKLRKKRSGRDVRLLFGHLRRKHSKHISLNEHG